jgi:nucleoside-diphosphate-sugar epimerase
MSQQLHVIFGAGQIGSMLAQRLLAQGHRVRVAKRSRTGIPAGAEAMLGDATDEGFCVSASQGAQAIYHCINPEYAIAEWRRLLPKWAANFIVAAGRTGARLVVLDNVYCYGPPKNGVVSVDMPMAPVSRKGEVRAQVTRQLMAAHEAGHAQVVIGRSSDFYGPGGTLSYYGDQFWPDALAGKPVRTITALDHPHTNHYIPDVAAGLAELGLAASDALGRAWMLPCAPAITPREMIAQCGAAAGREIRIAPTPMWMQRILSLFIPFLRETPEMAYQWETPFRMDDAPWRAQFTTTATAVAEGVAATAAWATRHYAASGAKG